MTTKVKNRWIWIAGIAALFFAGCTPVDDFGAYWSKGYADPALEGRWVKIGMPGELQSHTPGAEELRFIKNGSGYSLQMWNAHGQSKSNERRWDFRTLKAGARNLSMIKSVDGKGFLESYNISGDQLEIIEPDDGEALRLLQQRYPQNKNIEDTDGGRIIHTFDDQVYHVFQELARDPKYWMVQCRYKRAGR